MPRSTLFLLGACALLLATPAEAGKRRLSKADKARISADKVIVESMALRDRGLLDEALASVQGLVARQPDLVPAHLLYQEMAAVVRRNGGLVEAEYRHWMNLEPEDPNRMVLHAAATLTAALTTPAYLSSQADETGEARGAQRIRDIERSLAAAEVSEEAETWAHLVYAEVEQVRQRFPQVHERLKKAVEADPLNLSARGELIVLLVSQRETAAATEHCLELVSLAPWRISQCKALFPSGPGDDRVGTPEERQSVMDQVASIEKSAKGDPVILQGLRDFHSGVNEEETARLEALLLAGDADWTPPLRRNPYLAPMDGGEWSPDELEAIERLLTILEANSAPKLQVLALEAHENELHESPRVRAQYWRLLAGALREMGAEHRDRSRSALREAMKMRPEDPSLMNEWAYMSALDKVDLAEALEVSSKAIEMLLGREFDPIQIEPGADFGQFTQAVGESIGAYVDTRGWILYQLGRYEESVASLQLASTLTIDGTVQGHLGRARYALGQDEGAFQHLLRALAMGTEDEDEVRKLAAHLYGKSRVVAGGLEALVRETHSQILDELSAEGGRDDGAASGDSGVDSSAATDALDLPRFGSDSSHQLMGEAAPNLVIERIDGKGSLDLETLAGRVVVLDFWATWCGPCRKALPMFEALSLAFADEPVTFVMASVDDDLGEIEQFWDGLDMPVEVGLVQGKGADAFGVSGIPAMFIIDKDGTVVGHHVGYEEGEGEALAATLAALVTLQPGE